MTRIVRILLASLTVGAAACAARSADTSVQENQTDVLSVVRQVDTAWRDKDVAALDALLAPHYVYFSSRGGVTPRRSQLEFLASPEYILEADERSELEVFLSGETAVVSSRWRGHGRWRGETFRDDQRCSMVLSRVAGRWVLASEHCTQIAP
jgi:ketosteroid isomerase-like protein